MRDAGLLCGVVHKHLELAFHMLKSEFVLRLKPFKVLLQRQSMALLSVLPLALRVWRYALKELPMAKRLHV